MLEFDPNLIKYQKIFQVEEIQDLYFHFKQFNHHLPNNWNQLDLFTFNTYGLALLLGIDKEPKNKFTFYFLIERVDVISKRCYKIEIFPVSTESSGFTRNINGIEYQIANKDVASFLYTFTKVSLIKEEAIVKDDITLNRFLKSFNMKMCQNAVLPVPYSLHLKERSK